MENLLPDNILKLSISERIELVQDIWDSILINSEEVTVSESQKKELARRLKLYEQNYEQLAKWDDFKQKFN